MGSLHLDLAAAYQLLIQWVPEADQAPAGQHRDGRERDLPGTGPADSGLLPALGPGVLAVVDAPRDADLQAAPEGAARGNWPFPTVLSLELGGDRDRASALSSPTGPARVSIASAADNALRTFLAVLCLDEKRAQGRSRIVSREVSGVTVTTLEPPIPFAYAVDRKEHRLILGTSADAVGRFLECNSDPAAGDRFRRLRSLAFPRGPLVLLPGSFGRRGRRPRNIESGSRN